MRIAEMNVKTPMSGIVVYLPNENGATESTTYDAYQRTSTVTSADGVVTTYAYSYSPNQVKASISSPSAQWTRTTYDGFGRAVKVESAHDSTVVSTQDTKYSTCGATPLGKSSQASNPYGSGETEYWTTYIYDGSCRQTNATKPDNSVTANLYSGNTVQTTDPAGAWNNYANDAMGNLTSVTEPNPGGSGTLPTNYSYNAANQLTQVQMTRSGVTQTRTFTWTGADLASSTNPENGTVTYTYDGNHHALTSNDAKGQQTQYSYDSYERLTGVIHLLPSRSPPSLSSVPTQSVSYLYDVIPSTTPYGFSGYTMGRLTAASVSVEDPAQSTSQSNYGGTGNAWSIAYD